MKVSAVGRGLIVRNKSAGSSFIVFACFCRWWWSCLLMFIITFQQYLTRSQNYPSNLGMVPSWTTHDKSPAQSNVAQSSGTPRWLALKHRDLREKRWAQGRLVSWETSWWKGSMDDSFRKKWVYTICIIWDVLHLWSCWQHTYMRWIIVFFPS